MKSKRSGIARTWKVDFVWGERSYRRAFGSRETAIAFARRLVEWGHNPIDVWVRNIDVRKIHEPVVEVCSRTDYTGG